MPHSTESDLYSLPVSEPDSEEVDSRTRASRACQRCRLLKVVCKGGRPCQRCVLRDATCELIVDDERPDHPENSTSEDSSPSLNSALKQPAMTSLEVAEPAYLETFRPPGSELYGLLSTDSEDRKLAKLCYTKWDPLVIGTLDDDEEEEDKLVSSKPPKPRGRPTAVVSGVKTPGRPPRPK